MPTARARTGASSCADRRGIATAWVAGLALFLFAVAAGLYFLSGSTQKLVARATAGGAPMDLCLSALAEAHARLRDSVMEHKPLLGLDLDRALGPEFPFDFDDQGAPVAVPAIDVPETVRLAREIAAGLKVEAVRFASGTRTPPGAADPLVGTVELVARVTGTMYGLPVGREVAHRYPFTVPCQVLNMGSAGADYRSHSWGRPLLLMSRAGTTVTRL